jgi:dTDP-4-dehydrorhamnose 3,5-epimerase
VFIEVFRAQWDTHIKPLQWNVVASKSNVLRGVHAHWRHSDYIVVLQGRMSVGLQDLRYVCPTYGTAALLTLAGDDPRALVVPPGVAHGFFCPAPAIHLYAVSHYWDTEDELGCRWDDPDLQIPWPCSAPIISPRDADLSDLATLTRLLNKKLVIKSS